ncbi:ribonuclease III [Psychrobacter sp. YP14]|jgi:ribonuclease-3|uniref:Ribonuclease 3 n=3 Tax=Psychrobacter TaxID=497 RepID=A0A844LXM1_9GAMM|nr:ribonuclease III [Psychrobacter sp. YP14]MUG31456.1 ribonuclease III [Psychrobacter sanguinis]
MPKVFRKASGDNSKMTETAEIAHTSKQSPKQRYTSFELGLLSLQKQLGYSFNDTSLAKLALTHRSFDGKINYERLEFLGDALLGMIIGEALYYQYPKQDEGRLTRMRATLVRQESLVVVAQKLNLSSYLILGVGERKGGGRERASILADTVESLIGAIYLDSQSVDTVKACVLDWFAELIDNVNDQRVLKDAKSRLQEWLQGYKFELPNYDLLETQGNAPNQVFIVRCEVDVPHTTPIVESGESRRIAEQKTAEKMINQLNKLVNDRIIKVKA